MRLIVFLFPFLAALSAQVPEFTSSAMADAVEQITGHRAHMTNEIRLAGARPAGPAITLRLVRDEKASHPPFSKLVLNLVVG